MAGASTVSGGKSSLEKGKRGERELAKHLRERFGVEARRGSGQSRGGAEEPDVATSLPLVWLECKRQETESLPAWLAQAERDAERHQPANVFTPWRTLLPVVVFRRSRQPWRAYFRLRAGLDKFMDTSQAEELVPPDVVVTMTLDDFMACLGYPVIADGA